MRSRKTKAIAVFTSTLVIGMVAWAAWLTTGVGDGRARADSLDTLTITPDDASVVVELFPGQNGDIGMHVSNPNGVPLTITALTGSGAITPAICEVTANTAGLSAFVATNPTIPVGGADFTVPNGVSMGAGADTTCQGSDFDVPLTLQASTA